MQQALGPSRAIQTQESKGSSDLPLMVTIRPLTSDVSARSMSGPSATEPPAFGQAPIGFLTDRSVAILAVIRKHFHSGNGPDIGARNSLRLTRKASARETR